MYNERIFKRCFSYNKKYWYENIKNIPLYFKLMHYLIKHGYDEYATWEVFYWFIITMKPILQEYRNTHNGYPSVTFGYSPEDLEKQEQANVKYDATLDKMINLLDDMDECNPKYESDEYMKNPVKQHEEMNAAKDEFFKLFSEKFWNLWD